MSALVGTAPLILGAIGAILCWVALEWGKPFRKFFDLKRDGLEALSLYANVLIDSRREVVLINDDGVMGWDNRPETAGAKRLREAKEAFRLQGSRFLAFASTEGLAVSALKLFGFAPEEAGRGFIGLSNTIDEYGETRHQNRKLIERSLKV
jgi:hypothetical protein